jgi:acyl dehydratase
VPQSALRSYLVRFAAITHVGDVITCSGRVVEKFVQDGEQRLRLQLETVNQDGETKLSGEAVVALQ